MKLITNETLPSIVQDFDAILSRGLCSGVGSRDGQMCIEAAICAVLDLPHGDEPECVSESVRAYKIRLNDSQWSSPTARAAGLRDLGIAQLGSRGVVENVKFRELMALRTIQQLVPPLFKQIWPDGKMDVHVTAMQDAKDLPEAKRVVSDARSAAYAAADAAYAAYAAKPTAYAADAAAYAAAADAAYAAAAYAKRLTPTQDPDHYLLLSALIAYGVLVELGSPGALWLEQQKAVQ